MTDRRQSGEAGFILLETVIAFAILAAGLAVLMAVFSDVLDRSGRATTEATATTEAQSLLARVGADLPLADGEQRGDLPNGLRWRASTRLYGTDEDRRNWPVVAYQVVVTVLWSDGRRERSVTLTSLRLGGTPVAP